MPTSYDEVAAARLAHVRASVTSECNTSEMINNIDKGLGVISKYAVIYAKIARRHGFHVSF